MRHLIIDNASLAIVLNKIKNKFNKDKQFYVSIDDIQETRSNPQLKYYWLLISVIQEYFNEQGNNLSQEETSNEMKRRFFYKTLNINNKQVKVLKSIANNSETDVKAMTQFIDNIVNWCDEWNIIIPRCDDIYNNYEHTTNNI